MCIILSSDCGVIFSMLKTRTWILILLAILLICFLWGYFLFSVSGNTQIVEIRRDNELIKTIDLSAVTTPYTLSLDDGQGGINVLEIQKGKIRVQSANCADQVCVHRGWLSSGGTPVICLPHHLVISFSSSSIDGSTG